MRSLYLRALNLFDTALSVAFQTECILCGTLSLTLCKNCNGLFSLAPPYCNHCGDELSQPMERCSGCLPPVWDVLSGLRSFFWLKGAARELLLLAKYQRTYSALRRLWLLCEEHPMVLDNQWKVGCVVPIPTTPSRFAERGYNCAGWFAEKVAERWNVPCRYDVLVRRGTPLLQSGLSRKQRIEKAHAGFQTTPSRVPLPPRILLFDDVCTTGATLLACARLLRKEYPKLEDIYAVTLLRTPPASRLPSQQA